MPELKSFTAKYRRLTVKLPYNPRKGVCSASGKAGKTDLHHWVYLHKTSEVRKNPVLALDNSVELGFSAHRVANALKLVAEFSKQHPLLLERILTSMPRNMYRDFMRAMVE